MKAVRHAGWGAGDTELLPALRTLYAYTEREPGRASGWLWCERDLPHPPMMTARPWPPVLASLGPALAGDLEALTGIRFAAACYQAYLNGSGCGWHPDAEWDAQAILSLGVTRTFGLRHASSGTERYLQLAHGDLLILPPGMQHHWEHSVPAEDVKGERCSLVFRLPTAN